MIGDVDVRGEEQVLPDASSRDPDADELGRDRLSNTYGLMFLPLLSSWSSIICSRSCACACAGENVCQPFFCDMNEDAAVDVDLLLLSRPPCTVIGDIFELLKPVPVFVFCMSQTFIDRSSNLRAFMIDNGFRVHSVEAANVFPFISENSVLNSK